MNEGVFWFFILFPLSGFGLLGFYCYSQWKNAKEDLQTKKQAMVFKKLHKKNLLEK